MTRKITKASIDKVTDELRRQLEYELAPGVYGWTRETWDGALEIPSLRAEHEGDGRVGAYLDSLPRDRRVFVPLVTSSRLMGMLARRGFVERLRYLLEIRDWGEVWVRFPGNDPRNASDHPPTALARDVAEHRNMDMDAAARAIDDALYERPERQPL